MIRDPHFWKRFSVAVHEDDLAKEELAKQDGKNAYVITSTLPFREPTPLGTPTAQTPTATSQPSQPQMSQATPLRPLSPIRPFSLLLSSHPITTITASPPEEASPSTPSSKQKKRRSKLHKSPSTKPLIRPEIAAPIPPPTRTISIKTEHATITTSSRPGTQRSNFTPSIAPAPFSSRPGTRRSNLAPSILAPQQQHPTSPPLSPARSFFRTGNFSALSLSLSGRPNSRFNFVTTISADVENSDTWLARQKKKERHRAWLCWAFWGVLALLVVGVVVTVVVLRAHGIIRF
ncbi:hypothetical protein PTNB73_05123 [Pyrenophora teres f. teres]|uniref:Uncharacterized protein n=2 Tax=Pyrenophora teres f. teres TaxID=97479 RepID=E3RHV2_PYRTT|nr:hypothetical protein PTT_07526 [Pyrenophora teres f. teres 0-1]KAE8833489.1 hypothetical protein HRS9139_05308 [Pyrenophora teres f. teres]KAE8840742.1 hypothetical protein PTNB85_04141 [Pyrenophora teres f. teres]KAE8864238.1 hypothetical protein PTNB29_04202 [Pyrenophora teres f. teres]KAE8867029.1 hypothetical protein PTNB73_05123 [Pyrenophora teres f. teres]